MARTGLFGRLPRSAPSLQATLLAIAREYEQQRDQNLMDAWQKGGMFEGKKATDELVLAHWRERLAGVSKDDPLHDTYANAVTQTEYSIAESKMTAAYSNKKATDAQMVAFFVGWEKKVPKDSEFYRVLQRDAGQYMRSAQANAAALAKQAAENTYQTEQNSTRQSKEAAGEYAIDTLRRIAQSGYANGGIPPTIGAPGSNSDLTDFDPNDPAVMLKLLNAVDPQGQHLRGPNVAARTGFGNADVLYHDDDKKPVTGQDILAQLQKLDPSFKPGQPLDVGYITGLLDKQVQGLDERIARANKTGHLTDAANLEKSKAYVAEVNREVAAWPIMKSYAALRATRDAVMNDATASPQAQLAADATYRAALQKLGQDPRIAADDNLRSRLEAEAQGGQSGVPTLAESFTGLNTGAYDAGSAKDGADQEAQRNYLQTQVDAVANHQAVWTYGVTKGTNPDGTPHFVPQAGGTEIGASTPDAIQAGGANMQTMVVPDPKGGAPLTMLVTATPIYATATDPVTGLSVNPTNANPIGYAYDVVKGGVVVTQYGFQTKDQGFVFSENPPWDPSLHVTASSTGGNHLELDLTPVVTQKLLGGQDPASGQYAGTIDLNQNKDFGNGFSVVGATVSASGKVSPGKLVFDPMVAATSTDTRNLTGSADPATDFHSLTLAFLMTSQDGLAILNNLDKNPQIKQQLTNDAYAYAGATYDPASGTYVPGTGDQTKLQQANQQINMAASSTALVGAGTSFVDQALKLWQRTTTGSPFQGGQPATQPGQNGSMQPSSTTPQPLATDSVLGTAFHVLGSIFNPGTNQIKQPTSDQAGGLNIKTQGTLTLPGFDGPKGNEMLQVPKPIDLGQTSTQVGSTAPSASATLGGTQPQQQGSTAPAGGRYKPVPV